MRSHVIGFNPSAADGQAISGRVTLDLTRSQVTRNRAMPRK
jgi:hypothetical protein